MRHTLTHDVDGDGNAYIEAKLAAWLYKDARLRSDQVGAAKARREFRQDAQRMRECAEPLAASFGLFLMVWHAIETGDLDGAAEEILAWHPTVETEGLEEENDQRATIAREFVSSCIKFLDSRDSVGHSLESTVYDLMKDVAGRAEHVLNPDHADGFKRISHLRATLIETARLDAENRAQVAAAGGGPGLSRMVRGGGIRRFLSRDVGGPVRDRIRHAESVIASARLGNEPENLLAVINELIDVLLEPGLSQTASLRVAAALADGALVVDETHDDPAILLDAADRLDRNSAGPRTGALISSLVHLLRAQAFLTMLHDAPAEADRPFASAEVELRQAAATAERLIPELLPEIHARLAQLIVHREPEALDKAIEECRAGRHWGLRLWRRATAADITLARLLVWRALQDGTEPDHRITWIKEAIRLSRRQRRPWNAGGTQARLALNEALCTRDALSGDGDKNSRREGWREAAANSAHSTIANRVRLAAAWVAWAVGTDDADIAAEAYHNLISIVPLHAATRYRSAAKDKVLAAAQEHTEEAGYWLARARRYRDAVVALETGRAIKLSEITMRDQVQLVDLLAQAGERSLAERLGAALVILEDEERRPSSHPSSVLQRAWADVRAAARSITTMTGVDPVALDVNYADVTAATGDGSVVYIAAAKAGGYALIVAARHDPQFVELPRFDRASIAELLNAFLPDASGEPPSPDRIVYGLRWLWDNGMGDLMLMHARGRVVTLIPVGLLSLVPLHAAGDLGSPGDPSTEWRHAGHYSAVRYAPNARMLRWSRETEEQLEGTPLSLLAADVPDGHGCANHLSYVKAETNEVVRFWNSSTTTLRHNCTWEDFREAAGNCSVWHLACHGKAFPSAILDSTLYFADAQVTLDQIRSEFSSTRRRLAVLSACESHLIGISNPNEAIGLPSALLQLGFAGVVATAWPVHDRATRCLMAYFHQLWRHNGLPPAIALNHAQKWLRHATWSDLAALLPNPAPFPDGRPVKNRLCPFAHPMFWAAFAYTGA